MKPGAAPLLMTKLYLPAPRPDRVQRPRLTERLAAGLQRPLTLISAPAGFGKTSLLSDWRAAPEGRSCPLAWLSLDRGDNDPARFWSDVLAALKTVPGLAGLPDELEAEAPPELLLAPLINRLEAASALVDAAGRHPGLADDIRSILALMRTYIADMSGQPCELTEQVLRAPATCPEESAAVRDSADLIVAALLFNHGRLEESAARLAQVAERAMTRGYVGAVPSTVPRLAVIRLIQGQTGRRPTYAAAICAPLGRW